MPHAAFKVLGFFYGHHAGAAEAYAAAPLGLTVSAILVRHGSPLLVVGADGNPPGLLPLNGTIAIVPYESNQC